MKIDEIKYKLNKDESLIYNNDSVYKDRVIVFKVKGNEYIEEYHFNKKDEEFISTEERKSTLAKFEYFFEKYGINAIIKHEFNDNVDFGAIEFKGVNIEIITIKLKYHNGREKSTVFYGAANRNQVNYFKRVNNMVKNAIKSDKDKKEYEEFLINKYSKMTSIEKANYHYGQISFFERMQGGIPTKDKNPATSYFSKWFIDQFGKYDNSIIGTLEELAKIYKVDNQYLNEMVKYSIDKKEWKNYARKINLI